MSVSLSEKEENIFNDAKNYALKYLAPNSKKWEEGEGEPLEALKHLSENGYYGMGISKEYGGGGMNWLECSLAYEGLAHGCAGMVCFLILENNLVFGLVNYCEHSESVKKLIPDIVTGKKLISFAISEESSGSDISSNTSYAEFYDDEYHVFGEKAWVLNTYHSDYIMVTVKDKCKDKLIMLLIDKDSKGLTIGPNRPRMGCNIMYCSNITFDNCIVPKERLLSTDAFKTALKIIDIPRVMLPSAAIGISQRAIDITLEYLANRMSFKQPILASQGVQWSLAELSTKVEAGRWLAYRTASLFDSKNKDSIIAAMNKLYAPDLAMEVTTECLQLFGANGYDCDSEISRLMMAAKMMQIVDGTSQIQKLIIGRYFYRKYVNIK